MWCYVLVFAIYGFNVVVGTYILPDTCRPINRWRLFKDFLMWSLPSIPIFMLIFSICRFAHMRLGRPVAYKRHVDDQGDHVETCELFTELEAVDPKDNTRTEVQEARLRVHPSSRRKHHAKSDNNNKDMLRSAIEVARTARPRTDKKKSKRRTTKRVKGSKDAKAATEEEDATQRSAIESLSKTQSFSPISSEFYKSTQPSSVLPVDSATRPAEVTPTPGEVLADAIPLDVVSEPAEMTHTTPQKALPQYGYYGYSPHWQCGSGQQTQHQGEHPQSQSNPQTGSHRHYSGSNYTNRTQIPSREQNKPSMNRTDLMDAIPTLEQQPTPTHRSGARTARATAASRRRKGNAPP